MGSSSQTRLVMRSGQEADDDNLGIFLYLLDNNGVLSVLTTYNFMIK